MNIIVTFVRTKVPKKPPKEIKNYPIFYFDSTQTNDHTFYQISPTALLPNLILLPCCNSGLDPESEVASGRLAVLVFGF